MSDDDKRERIDSVLRLLRGHVFGGPIVSIRLPSALEKLAKQIVDALGEQPRSGLWRKWTEDREELAKRASTTWFPLEALRETLNEMPGPPLSKTDVKQKVESIRNEPYGDGSPPEQHREACLALYERERTEGTEAIAIIHAMEDYCADVRSQEYQSQIAQRAEKRAAEQQEKELTFLQGVDCGWTTIQGRAGIAFCRINGRIFRRSRSPSKKGAIDVHRVGSVDEKDGRLIGTYARTTEAMTALQNIAYQWERPLKGQAVRSPT